MKAPMAQNTRGFTMLEVLVAILVVTLGLLGLAGLQTVSLRNNTSSSQRTIATQLAYDMADRMRANAAGILEGDYDWRNYGAAASVDCRRSGPWAPGTPSCPFVSPGIVAAPKGTFTANCTTVTGCPPQQLAYWDIAEWNLQICNSLPQTSACTDPAAPAPAVGPWGVVCIDSTPNDGTPTAPACDGVAGAPYVIKIWWLEDRNNPALPLKQWVTTFVP